MKTEQYSLSSYPYIEKFLQIIENCKKYSTGNAAHPKGSVAEPHHNFAPPIPDKIMVQLRLLRTTQKFLKRRKYYSSFYEENTYTVIK
jgi:hypothetical protein